MSRFFVPLSILLFLLTLPLSAANYYFSALTGDDSRLSIEARNPETPWKSLKKLNSIFKSLQPGDSILFKRDETFYGTITISQSGTADKPIVLGAYGSGSKPIITSLIDLKDLKCRENGVYEIEHHQLGSTLNIVSLNNEIQEMGRFPNREGADKGYLVFEATNGVNSISDNELQATPDWSGGELVIRKSHWTIDRYNIDAHKGNTLSYTERAMEYNPIKNYGYFIQGHLETLDQLGEWHYEPSSKTLFVFLGEKNPKSILLQASTIDYLVTNHSGTAYINFNNLHFKGANKDAFYLRQGRNFSIDHCKIEGSGENGINAKDIPYFSLKNSKIVNSLNNGVDLGQNTPYATLNNNLVENTNLFAGMGKSGVGNGLAIQASSEHNLIEYNSIINTGYIGIRFGGDSTIIKNNYIDTFCLIRDDGGGIYTWSGSTKEVNYGRKIIGNIIINGIGAKEGTPLPKIERAPAEGIYIDDNSSGIEIIGNTVANSGKGIYLHNSKDLIVRDNTIFNNFHQIYISQNARDSQMRNIRFINNIVFSPSPDQNTISLISNRDDIQDLAAFKTNYFSHYKGHLPAYIRKTVNDSLQISGVYDIEGLEAINHSIKGSIKSEIPLKKNKITQESSVSKIINGNFDSSIDGLYCFSPGNNCQISRVENVMDGGSLKVEGEGLSFLLIGVGSISHEKSYVLRFSAMSDKDVGLRLFLRQSTAPYQQISHYKTVQLGEERKEYEIIIDGPISENNGSIVFESGGEGVAYILDNIELYETETGTKANDDFIRFEYNPSKDTKHIKLDKDYRDLTGKNYSESLILQPFSSAILLKQE